MQPFEKDARTYGGYLSDSVYTLLAQSTLPRETNVANAIARMAQMPRIIEEAKRSLTHPAKPILETAIRQNAARSIFIRVTFSNWRAIRRKKINWPRRHQKLWRC